MVIWNADMPNPGQLISKSQPLLKQNNQSIDSVFNDPDNGKFTKFVVQNAGEIAAALVDPLSAFHTILGTGITQNAKPLPYFKNSNGDYPLMPDLKRGADSGINSYSFVIGDIVIKFGIIDLVNGLLNGVTFQSGSGIELKLGDFPNNCFTVIANINTSGNAPSVDILTINTKNISKTGFTVQKSSVSQITSINFIAIGN